MSSISVGIDLGTTHSLIAVFDAENGATLVRNGDGAALTPSVVGLSDDGTLLVGGPAHAQRLRKPAQTHAAFKRHMGTGKEFALGRQRLSAPQLSALVLRKLHTDLEAAYPGAEIDALVISVPAYFSSAQREATMLAAELAGLPRPRLVNEPTAAALAYGLNEREGEQTFIVLDLGGGTFDVSIIEMFEGVMEVRASSGDAMLGGGDFTACLRRDIVERLQLDGRPLSAAEQARIEAAAEALKRHLSRAEQAEATIALDDGPQDYRIDRRRFEELCAGLLMRMRRPIERCLYDARLEVGEIDRVMLVGGATRMTMIRGLVSRMLRRLPESGLDPDEVVALGAAVQAGLAARNTALADMVMTDVAPFSLGIASRIATESGIIEGGFAPIIERNTTLPASRMQQFTTIQDNQDMIEIAVYQGEAPIAVENVLIGKTHVAMPRGKAGTQQIEVRFSYDSSGLLHVRITVLSTGAQTDLVIEGSAAALSPAERRRRLQELAAYMLHPREDGDNLALSERLKGLYAMFLGADRAYVAELIARFETALNEQDPRRIADLRKELARTADELERSYVR
ncbi:molecular chaperone HscC [Paracoccus aminovorans]|uniref:Molecular chaperone HscC n=1 Tax=Paracoccus aminovorans TaxID=34004 RepID=A0A1I3AT46_9RHOB|nr:Hsp70 family protein [Paracoccus aminovorans]CQR84339.1 chaperone protein HscC [Paracoccus aminovorans]SFH52511.1 molecular chaperone HscC [Paracoccus aminovorans]